MLRAGLAVIWKKKNCLFSPSSTKSEPPSSLRYEYGKEPPSTFSPNSPAPDLSVFEPGVHQPSWLPRCPDVAETHGQPCARSSDKDRSGGQNNYCQLLMEPKSNPLQDIRHMLTWSVQTYTVGNLHVIIPISVCLIFSTK